MTDRSTLPVTSPRLVPLSATCAALMSSPVLLKVFQFSLATGVTTAEPFAALLSTASTP